MAKLLEISKNKGPCDPRLHCSTKLENFSFSLRSFFLLVHKVSSSIFPYMDLNLAFTSFFFFHGKARERNFWYWLTLFAKVFSNLKMKISLKQFNPTEIIWRKKNYMQKQYSNNKHNGNIIFISFEKACFPVNINKWTQKVVHLNLKDIWLWYIWDIPS